MESVLVESAGGEYVLQSVIRDISERKEAEMAARESEKEHERLSLQLMHVQESERKRIAREIHDGIGQALGGAKYTLESAIKRLDRNACDPESIDAPLSIIPMLQNIFAELRRIQSDLRPPILDDLGLEAAVGWACRQVQENGGIAQVETKLDLKGLDFSDSLKTAIFRVVQEGLTNVTKHSKASQVFLSLLRRNKSIELVIRDNGCGFDQGKVAAIGNLNNGIGLSSMKERTEHIGGEFHVESVVGQGTTLRVSLPIDSSSPQAYSRGGKEKVGVVSR